MQNKVLKMIAIISVFLIVSIFPITTFSTWVDDARNFLEAADETAKLNGDKLESASNDIYNLLSSIGMIIAVVVGIILGITYMIAGSEEKAKVKESLMPYIIGCIVIFGAFGIWKLVISTFKGI